MAEQSKAVDGVKSIAVSVLKSFLQEKLERHKNAEKAAHASGQLVSAMMNATKHQEVARILSFIDDLTKE